MRTEVHGITKTRIEFLSNEIQARIVLVNGDAYIATFPSTFNFHSGGHFIKLLERLFDMYAVGQTLNLKSLKEINAQLYLSDMRPGCGQGGRTKKNRTKNKGTKA